MTTINLSTDIPSDINTLERLTAWAIMSLRRTNPTARVIEVSDEAPVTIIQSAIVQADDGSVRLFGRVSMPIAADYAEDNVNKLWMKTEEISNTELPAAFKVN